jgi:hypothetical protein
MKSCMPLAAMLFAAATFPLLAQQPTSPEQPGTPPSQPTTQQNPSSAQQPSQTSPTSQSSPATNADTSAAPTSTAPMSPVSGELVSKLDSKTAKAGDNVIVQTKASVKTDNGTEVPEGSKLVGHVLAVQPSGEGTNSQVVLQFDHFELKGGQNLPVHSQIESIGSAQNTASANGQTAGSPNSMTPPQAGSADRSPNQSSNSPSANGASSSSPSAAGSSSASATNGGNASSDSRTAPMGNSAPAAGTVVAKNGNIAIQTTSIPGVLLANNAPGQSDPRMARASSILLGLKRDIQLESGTQVVVDVSPTPTAAH